MRQKRKLLITLLVLTVIVGILLFSSMVRVFMQQPDDNASPIMFSENVYVILVFAILLPIFLGVMIKHIIKTHNEYFDEIREQEIEAPKPKAAPEVSIEHSEMPVTFGFAVGASEPENKEEDEEEESPRFYMLDKTDREMSVRKEVEYDTQKDLKELWYVPTNKSGTITIPDGTEKIRKGFFDKVCVFGIGEMIRPSFPA